MQLPSSHGPSSGPQQPQRQAPRQPGYPSATASSLKNPVLGRPTRSYQTKQKLHNDSTPLKHRQAAPQN